MSAAPPLVGVRVVEVAQYVAGPLCGMLLAQLGADVVKVEPPGGDAYRGTMPVAPELGRFFLPLNQGKRSCVLDLKTEPGRMGLASLADRADVVLHNAPPERALAFGLDWETLHARVPGLVLGVVSSFGPEGPLASVPAYDLVAQARSGLLTAHASRGDAVPVRAGGVPLADLTAGLLLASASLAALVRARTTGVGERVEVSLLAAALAVQVQDVVWLEGEDVEGDPTATRADLAARADEIHAGIATNPYYRCFEAADGYLAVACLNPGQRAALAGLLGLDDPTIDAPDVLPDDPELRRRKEEVTERAEAAIRREPVAVWLVRLGEAGVPCGPVHARERVRADAQIRANGLLRHVEQPGLGALTLLGGLFGLEAGARPLRPAPLVGEHTAEVLAEVAG